jgi:hypothetical protein
MSPCVGDGSRQGRFANRPYDARIRLSIGTQKHLRCFAFGFRQGGVGVNAQGQIIRQGAHFDGQHGFAMSASAFRPTMPIPRMRRLSGSMSSLVSPWVAPMVTARPECFQ